MLASFLNYRVPFGRTEAIAVPEPRLMEKSVLRQVSVRCNAHFNNGVTIPKTIQIINLGADWPIENTAVLQEAVGDIFGCVVPPFCTHVPKSSCAMIHSTQQSASSIYVYGHTRGGN